MVDSAETETAIERQNSSIKSKIQGINTVIRESKETDNDDSSFMISNQRELLSTNNGILFMKDRLSNTYAVIMLLSAALGSGFLCLPYTFYKFPLETFAIVIFNYASGLYSCYLLIQVCEITQLGSMQEFVYKFGGGRASIIFITGLQIILYSIMPINFIYNLNMIMQEQLKDQGLIISDLAEDGIVILIGIALLPVVMIRDFHRIQIVGVLIFIANMTLLICVAVFSSLQDKSKFKDPESAGYNYNDVTTFIPKISFAFEYQVYFLIVYQYLNKIKRPFYGNVIVVVTSSFMLVYSLLFCALSVGAYQIYLNSYGYVELNYSVSQFTWVLNWLILLISLLQIPFKFYLGKEFVFLFIDELKNKSISQKIDDLNYYQYGQHMYSEKMIRKIRDDLYQIVRLPYMRISNCQYYTVATIAYIINFAVVIVIKILFPSNAHSSNPVSYIVRISAAFVQPLIDYVLAGYFYYRACAVYDIQSKNKYFALAFCVLGFFVMAANVGLVFYDIVLTTYFS